MDRPRNLLIKGLVEEAISELRKNLETNPSDAAAWFWLGVAQEDGNDLRRAAAAFENADDDTPADCKEGGADPDVYRVCYVKWNAAVGSYESAVTFCCDGEAP